MLLVVAVALSCTGDPVQRAIEAQIASGVEAIKTENIDAFLDQFPKEVFPGDSAAVEQAIAAFRANTLVEWGVTRTRSLSIRVDSVSAAQDSAIVATSMHWDRIITFPPRADTVVSNIWHRELWRRTPKGWRMFKLLRYGGTTTTNGKEASVGG